MPKRPATDPVHRSGSKRPRLLPTPTPAQLADLMDELTAVAGPPVTLPTGTRAYSAPLPAPPHTFAPLPVVGRPEPGTGLTRCLVAHRPLRVFNFCDRYATATTLARYLTARGRTAPDIDSIACAAADSVGICAASALDVFRALVPLGIHGYLVDGSAEKPIPARVVTELYITHSTAPVSETLLVTTAQPFFVDKQTEFLGEAPLETLRPVRVAKARLAGLLKYAREDPGFFGLRGTGSTVQRLALLVSCLGAGISPHTKHRSDWIRTIILKRNAHVTAGGAPLSASEQIVYNAVITRALLIFRPSALSPRDYVPLHDAEVVAD